MADTARRGGKKNRKHGRNKTFCAMYSAENRRVKNKKEKLRRHIKRLPSDEQAKGVLAMI